MFYRENGQFKTSYAADQQIFTIAQDKWFVWGVIAFAALAVGYGLGEQAQLGEQEAQTVTQEVRQTGDVKRLCMTVKTGERIDAMSCELIDPLSGGVK